MQRPEPIEANEDTIYIGMQLDEDVAVADCRCTLYRMPDFVDDPAVVLCPMHAAAPDLLAALHAISFHLDQVPVVSKTGDHVDDAQSIARAAIRKATGG